MSFRKRNRQLQPNCQQLKRFISSAARKLPDLVNSKGIILQKVNAHPHTERNTQDQIQIQVLCLENLQTTTLLSRQCLRGENLIYRDQVENELSVFFNSNSESVKKVFKN